MDLILWRHAEAEPLKEGEDDLSRQLTPKGERQAARMSDWLERHLPEGTRILASPARRTEQTVLALGRKYKLREELCPDATPEGVMHLLKWNEETGPQGKGPVLLVGHQPWMGQLIARLIKLQGPECSIRKGSVWWLRTRVRDDKLQTVLLTVTCPELISRSWDDRS